MTHPTPLSTAASEEDLVERLRYLAGYQSSPTYDTMHQAADEIERLRQVAGDASDLVKALEELTGACERDYTSPETEDADGFPDDESVAGSPNGDSILKFGMIRRARSALTRHRQGEK